jgi:two-component system chemotaxis sensor kinase CheA
MNLDDALLTFILESRELLGEMENALLAIEQTDEKDELINAIFRAAHTIKGSAGLFSLDPVVAFTHDVESVLDQVRAGHLNMADKSMVLLLLSCCDHMGRLVNAVASGQSEFEADLLQDGEPLSVLLQSYLAKSDLPEPQPKAIHPAPEQANVLGRWCISLKFGPDVLKNGMDPLSFIRYLGTFGKVTGLTTVETIPTMDGMDPEACYLGFEIEFETDAEREAIEQVFEFVRDDCTLHIVPVAWLNTSPLKTAQPTSMPDQPELATGKNKQSPELVVPESRSIRVDADKLDQLINLVGGLIIAGASVNLIARKAQISELQDSISKLSMLVEEVRDSALQLRMVKIGVSFKRFQRVVHDVAHDLGKDIALCLAGEDTELDKTLIEKIADPLLHLVRNAMDHGIESPQARAAKGKAAQGTLKLNAFHDSGAIVITVQDDGAGLHRQRILDKALQRGLVESGQVLSDKEVYALVFEPGFSTAEKISNLSGRGVGLDVVKRNISALRGTVVLDSEEGVGTTVTIRLPLTLAIIDGFLVEVGKVVYAIPLDMIEECVAYTAEPGHDYTSLRGEVLPFIRLRELFSVSGKPIRRENIVVLKYAGQKAGLVVDTLLGEYQTVIKPLGQMFNQLSCISGSTILGSGDVALILDVPSLVRQAVAKGTSVHAELAVPT